MVVNKRHRQLQAEIASGLLPSRKGGEDIPLMFINPVYYIALSYKDWELLNSRIWLAENDIDRSLNFLI